MTLWKLYSYNILNVINLSLNQKAYHKIINNDYHIYIQQLKNQLNCKLSKI